MDAKSGKRAFRGAPIRIRPPKKGLGLATHTEHRATPQQKIQQTMDPTLAPGYVALNKSQGKAAKGHHWAEVQKKRTKTATAKSENDGSSSMGIGGRQILKKSRME